MSKQLFIKDQVSKSMIYPLFFCVDKHISIFAIQQSYIASLQQKRLIYRIKELITIKLIHEN
ncbi:MAG: hypothetical protein AABY22_25170 [Nanoarchaeota archaeon]